MSIVGTSRNLERFFVRLAEDLDVPASKYKDAKDRYEAVGDWLSRKSSPLAVFDPEIFPQGSFALGTVVQPIGGEDYDIDAMCVLKIRKSGTSQRDVKDKVGDRLKAHDTYREMLEPAEGTRRCWRLKYADESGFHLDMTPAIPDDGSMLVLMGVPVAQAQHAVCITDKKAMDAGEDWPRSNPRGYIAWFKDRMKVRFHEQRQALAAARNADVESVPEYEVRVPLQRVIQLLKRHRDVKFGDDPDKPISIIITTLAARSYNNETNVFDALRNAVQAMRTAPVRRNGAWFIPNPVDPRENFADKWNENPRKAELFFEWATGLQADFAALSDDMTPTELGERLGEAFGRRSASAVLSKFGGINGTAVLASPSFIVTALHRKTPPWPMAITGNVEVRGESHRPGFEKRMFGMRGRRLEKHFKLRFTAKTSIQRPFQIYWQVVNTGEDARRAGNLRGGFEPGGLEHDESTLYEGKHSIECFIVKDGRCVARSGECVIQID